MEALVAGAAAVLVGIFSGSAITSKLKGKKEDLAYHEHSEYSELVNRVDIVERIIPTLISRNEVQSAINQVPPLVMQAVQSEMNGKVAGSFVQKDPVNPFTVPSKQPEQARVPSTSTLKAAQANLEKMKELDAMLKNFEQLQQKQ